MTVGTPIKYPNLRIAPKLTDNIRFVYFVRIGDLTKIGFSKNVRERARCLQKIVGEPAEIILAFPTMRYNGDLHWHTLFSDKRVAGEWFTLDTADYERVFDILAAYPDQNARWQELHNWHLARNGKTSPQPLHRWRLYDLGPRRWFAEREDGREEEILQDHHCKACAMIELMSFKEDAYVDIRGLYRYGECYQSLVALVRERQIKQRARAQRLAHQSPAPTQGG